MSHRADLELVWRPRQLAFDLPPLEGLDPADFLTESSNRTAAQAVLAWPGWPTTALLLIGPEGSGKTHLARIWAARAGAVLLQGAAIWEPARPLQRVGEAAGAAIDDADEIGDEVLLLHLYNGLRERGGHLLLTAATPLAAWPCRLPDLHSRLRTAWLVEIEPPGDALLAALLVKQLADRQLRVEQDVVSYLVSRMERSFAAVRQLVTALDSTSLQAQRPISVPLARLVLAGLAGQDVDEAAQPASPTQDRRQEEWISA